MLKKDVLEYLGHEEGCRTGAITKLASMLNITMPAISFWGERLPMKQAVRLDKFLRDKGNLKKFELSAKGRPTFNIDDYEV